MEFVAGGHCYHAELGLVLKCTIWVTACLILFICLRVSYFFNLPSFSWFIYFLLTNLHKNLHEQMGFDKDHSLRSWREWVSVRNFLRLRPRGNSTRLLPILLATCAAFCTRVRDRSSRGYPLPPATQATKIMVKIIGIHWRPHLLHCWRLVKRKQINQQHAVVFSFSNLICPDFSSLFFSWMGLVYSFSTAHNYKSIWLHIRVSFSCFCLEGPPAPTFKGEALGTRLVNEM